MGELGETNVNLNCEIDANPRVIALFWVLDGNGTTLAEGEVVDDAWTLVMVNKFIYYFLLVYLVNIREPRQ